MFKDESRTISTGINWYKNKLIPTDTTDINILIPIDSNNISVDSKRTYDCDHLYNDLGDLVNNDFRAWYISRFYALGRDNVLRLASVAKADGKNPKKYFSHLLKKGKL